MALYQLSRRTMMQTLLATCLLASLTGCHAIDLYTPAMQSPVPPGMEPPRELSKVSLPTYRIEPPDILRVEMLKLVPLPPYRIDIYDALEIRVLGTLLDQPINNLYLVEGEGIVSLGPAYGTVRVAGMTIEEATAQITRYLQQVLRQPEVSVRLARSAGTQQLTGEYAVQPDGAINLRRYGTVHVAGKTVTEARLLVERQLAQYFDGPQVAVEVGAYNSKNYFVITAGAGLGDHIVPFPITGNETVLDAISQMQGLSQVSSKTIWVARAAPGGVGCEQILPVDFQAVTRGGSTATNYQILPGDRIYIVGDGLIAFNSFVNKTTAPLEKLLGLTGFGMTTMRGIQLLGRFSTNPVFAPAP